MELQAVTTNCDRCRDLSDDALKRLRQDNEFLKRVGALVYRTDGTLLEPAGLAYAIPGSELTALCALLRAYPRIATHAELAGTDVNASNIARIRVYRLRETLAGLGVEIVTHQSYGYRLIPTSRGTA